MSSTESKTPVQTGRVGSLTENEAKALGELKAQIAAKNVRNHMQYVFHSVGHCSIVSVL